MSTEMALSFINRVNTDLGLQSKLAIIAGNVEGLIKVAKDAGFSFTSDEWFAAAARAFSSELSEDELAMVAGGGSNTAGPAFKWASSFLQPGNDRSTFDAFTPPPAGLA